MLQHLLQRQAVLGLLDQQLQGGESGGTSVVGREASGHRHTHAALPQSVRFSPPGHRRLTTVPNLAVAAAAAANPATHPPDQVLGAVGVLGGGRELEVDAQDALVCLRVPRSLKGRLTIQELVAQHALR